MTTPDAYLLVVATGNEGAFTPDELRDLLRRGRARAGDRLYDPRSHATSEVRQVVPEADNLERTAARPSDRILRTTSDRQQAVVRAQADERRRTSERLPTVEVAPQAATQSSDELPAGSPAEPTATADLRRTSERTVAARILEESDRARRKRLRRLGFVLALTTIGTVVMWWPGTPPPPTMVWVPPSYPALTEAELSGLTGEALLRRVSEDSLCRVAHAQRGWNCGPEVLSPLANAVWTIHRMEQGLLSFNLESALASDRSEVKPPWPSLAHLAAAYEAMALPEPARILRQALEDPRRPLGSAELEQLDRQFKAAIGAGSNPRLIAALTERRDEILSAHLPGAPGIPAVTPSDR